MNTITITITKASSRTPKRFIYLRPSPLQLSANRSPCNIARCSQREASEISSRFLAERIRFWTSICSSRQQPSGPITGVWLEEMEHVTSRLLPGQDPWDWTGLDWTGLCWCLRTLRMLGCLRVCIHQQSPVQSSPVQSSPVSRVLPSQKSRCSMFHFLQSDSSDRARRNKLTQGRLFL
jgi:hypothetical protein